MSPKEKETKNRERVKDMVDQYLSSRQKGISKYDSALIAIKNDNKDRERENTLLLARELGVVVPGMSPIAILREIGKERNDVKFERLNERLKMSVEAPAPVADPRAAEDLTGSGFVINRGFSKVSVPYHMETRYL